MLDEPGIEPTPPRQPSPGRGAIRISAATVAVLALVPIADVILNHPPTGSFRAKLGMLVAAPAMPCVFGLGPIAVVPVLVFWSAVGYLLGHALFAPRRAAGGRWRPGRELWIAAALVAVILYAAYWGAHWNPD